MKHSKVVGGSTAKRVMNCPASVALCEQMPDKPSSEYADRGTLLHNAMDAILSTDIDPKSVIGMKYEGQELTPDLYEEKIVVAMAMLDEVDPDEQMNYTTEVEVGLDHLIPGVFGNADMIGRIGDKAIVLDWKMGDGIPVDAEESEQGMFYALAAMHTQATKWAFEGVKEVEIIIAQPPHLRRWTTDVARLQRFGIELVEAVKESARDDARLNVGEWCKWCSAKPICPKMTGAVDRALKTKIEGLPLDHINGYLKSADMLEGWISDLRALAFQMLEAGTPLPDWKLVAKRGTRKWTDAKAAEKMLVESGVHPYAPQEVVSPAQAEKLLKKVKKPLPDDLVVSVSSGSTLAPRSDPRPEVVQIGTVLTNALAKLI